MSNGRFSRVADVVLMLGALILIWEFLVRALDIQPFLLPAPFFGLCRARQGPL